MSATAETGRGERRILVVGVGNPDRGDDALGVNVAQALSGRLPADVTVLARSGDMLALIDDWEGFDTVICVDAAASLGTPGRIHRIDLAREDLPRDVSFPSSHFFGVAEAIDLARALGRAPRDLVVYAVEGGTFAIGAPLSEEVKSAGREVADRVAAEVDTLRRARGGVGARQIAGEISERA